MKSPKTHEPPEPSGHSTRNPKPAPACARGRPAWPKPDEERSRMVVLLGLGALALLAVVGLSLQFEILHFQFAMAGLALATSPVALTPEQLEEFNSILSEIKGGWGRVKELPDLLKRVEDENAALKLEVGKLKKSQLTGATMTGVRWVNGVPFVSDDCARALSALYLISGEKQGKLKEIVQEASRRDQLLGKSAEYLGIETKAALSGSDIPLPTVYVPQVVELVWKYGQFRAHATVFPLGAGTVNLPQLKAGEDAFGIIAVSAGAGEKKVAAQNVTFTAQKSRRHHPHPDGDRRGHVHSAGPVSGALHRAAIRALRGPAGVPGRRLRHLCQSQRRGHLCRWAKPGAADPTGVGQDQAERRYTGGLAQPAGAGESGGAVQRGLLLSSDNGSAALDLQHQRDGDPVSASAREPAGDARWVPDPLGGRDAGL